MSLLRAAGLRWRPQSARLPSIAALNNQAGLRRYYSDETSPQENQPEKPPEEVPSPKTEPQSTPKAWKVNRNKGAVRRAVKTSRIVYKNELPVHARWHKITFPELFVVSKDVEKALQEGEPVVALETAIYTHGFPKPDNFTLALEMEHTVRDHGAVPATIGILNGKIYIGMSNEQLEELAYTAGTPKTHKISRRDIAYHLGKSGDPLNGGTTISGTIKIATSAGISVVATGGLGGVHKGGENSLDISADLTELGKTGVAVVTSGMKSFLDTERTMEFLETQGVFVSTFGDPEEKVDIPGFFSRDSGFPSPYIVRDPEEAANIFFANQLLKVDSGCLFFNPIPEEYEIPRSEIDPILADATSKASSITGKDNTPAVLNEIVKQTEGRSIRANRRLVLNNAKAGAQLAVHLSQLYKDMNEEKKELFNDFAQQNPKMSTKSHKLRPVYLAPDNQSSKWRRVERGGPFNFDQRSYSTAAAPFEPSTAEAPTNPNAKNRPKNSGFKLKAFHDPKPIVVVGGVGIDAIGTAGQTHAQVSNPGSVNFSVGGVAKNIAATIAQLDERHRVFLVSDIGEDYHGLNILSELDALGLDISEIKIRPEEKTACYLAVNSDTVQGGLSTAIADMDITTKILPKRLSAVFQHRKPGVVCFDGNLAPDTTVLLCKHAKRENAIVVCEPTSAAKAGRIAQQFPQLKHWPKHEIDIISPNVHELDQMYTTWILSADSRTPKLHQKTVYCQGFIRDQDSVEDTPELEKKNKPLVRFHKNIQSIASQLREHRNVKTPNPEELITIVKKATAILAVTPTLLIKLGDEGVLVVRLVSSPNETQQGPPYTYHENIYMPPSEPDASKALKEDLELSLGVEVYMPFGSMNPMTPATGIHILWMPAQPLPEGAQVVNSNGAGDTFLGTFVSEMINQSKMDDGAIQQQPWRSLQGADLLALLRKAQTKAAQVLMLAESHYISDRETYVKRTEWSSGRIWRFVKHRKPEWQSHLATQKNAKR
ncbi:hypothetical protein H072_8423 [Dactylellina haptotyla CBS 200.50]|uniref:Carbohydrate kinase PfkB domain-containing protein n=1 Tax=Dactylellina haptotyla (strain CBS 200.50) TaxID=1284197 RepID=S8A4U6_DACHA|nr:hypothetical protein H072_8423 [Dactylellina haptotyla CBS 200.50]